MKIHVASVDSVIIYFGDTISQSINEKVKNAYSVLKDTKNPAFIEIIPSYSSILVQYDIFAYDFQKIQYYIEDILSTATPTKSLKKVEKQLLSIDVYYDSQVGFDLEKVASISKLTIQEVIQIHSQKVYDVYAIGFLPGFGYLGEVDHLIQVPRLKTPREKIPKNSVALADKQTAIYPMDSPGGWNIIGKTAFELIDTNSSTLCPFDINTQIKFNPITKEEFLYQGGIL